MRVDEAVAQVSFAGPNMTDLQAFFISNLCDRLITSSYIVLADIRNVFPTFFFLNTPQVHKRNTLVEYLSKAVCKVHVYKLISINRFMHETRLVHG